MNIASFSQIPLYDPTQIYDQLMTYVHAYEQSQPADSTQIPGSNQPPDSTQTSDSTQTYLSEIPVEYLQYCFSSPETTLMQKISCLLELRSRAVQNGADPNLLDGLMERLLDPYYVMSDQELEALGFMLSLDPFDLYYFSQDAQNVDDDYGDY